jgi:protein-serine/threonine kinase
MPLDDTSSVFCQVMEYCDGGDLFDLLPHQLETDEANCLFKQLIRGVHFMHSMGIAHRDLKPGKTNISLFLSSTCNHFLSLSLLAQENLLLTSTGCLKISDFGSAAYFSKNAILVKSKGVVGSAPYIAPEEFVQQEYDASKVDIWSCGMIYMAMRTGTHLWHVAQQGKDDVYDRYLEFRHLLQDERDEARHHSDTLTHADCISMAKTTIKEKAKQGGYDVLEDLETASKKLVYRLLDPAPEKRILTPDILKNEWFGNIKTCQSD